MMVVLGMSMWDKGLSFRVSFEVKNGDTVLEFQCAPFEPNIELFVLVRVGLGNSMWAWDHHLKFSYVGLGLWH